MWPVNHEIRRRSLPVLALLAGVFVGGPPAPADDRGHGSPGEGPSPTSLLVAFDGEPVDGTVAETYIDGIENTDFRRIVEDDLALLASIGPELENLRIRSWHSVANAASVAWRAPEGFGVLRRVKRALEALPYVEAVDLDRPLDLPPAGADSAAIPRARQAQLACAPSGRGTRRIDLRAPEVSLRLLTPPGFPPGEFVMRAKARDECGVFTVQASLNGNVTGSRTREPYDFSFQVPAFPVEVCALATDPSGNARKVCEMVASQPAPHGCLDSGQCVPGEYCQKAPGHCDGIGECAPQPGACALFYDPVCGCDGTTYSNDACAAVSGVNVAYEGECL